MQFPTAEESWKRISLRFGNEIVSKRVLKMVAFFEIDLGCMNSSVIIKFNLFVFIFLCTIPSNWQSKTNHTKTTRNIREKRKDKRLFLNIYFNKINFCIIFCWFGQRDIKVFPVKTDICRVHDEGAGSSSSDPHLTLCSVSFGSCN